MILIDAAYINESGGLVLLEEIIKEFAKLKKIKIYLLLDNRISKSFINKLNIDFTLIYSSEKNRKKFYLKNSIRFNKIFCFSNVPPPIKTNVETFILFHNKLIISNFIDLKLFSFKSKFLYFIKKKYILFKNKSHYKWIVQTQSMKKKLSLNLFINEKKIFVMPFYKEFLNNEKTSHLKKKNLFTYIADGGLNKNHNNLLDAWLLLHNEYSVSPKLLLTVSDKYPKLLSKIDNLKKMGINIYNHGLCNRNEINSIYQNSEFLIYPSFIESFGLPLVEANHFNCKIISSDLDYVHDIIEPSLVFDPSSVISISKTVYLALQDSNIPKTKILIKSKTNKLLKLFYE
jgi:glycosyltransferase involved in cell wall biosynthesis